MTGSRKISWALGAAALALLLWRLTQPARPSGWRLTPVTFDTGVTGWPAISADGQTLVYASDRDPGGNLDLYIQPAPSGAPRRLTETPEDESEPAISPDGKSVAYHSTKDGGGIYVIPAGGGQPRLLVQGGRTPRYSPDGRWVAFRTEAGAFVIAARGGQQRQLYPAMALTAAPVWSPDGRRLLLGNASGTWVAPLEPGTAEDTGISGRLGEAGFPKTLPSDANWTARGLIFSARSAWTRDLYACPLDAHGKPGGPVERITTGTEDVRDAAASRSGRVAFASGIERFDVWGLPLDPATGKAAGPPYRITHSLAPTASPFLSADGTRLLFNSSRHGFAEVWMKDLPAGAERVVATGPSGASGGRFLRESGKIAYLREDGLYLLDPDTGESSKLAGSVHTLWDIDRAGKTALVAAPGGADALDLETGRRMELLRPPGHARVWGLEFSPDDAWILFVVSNGTEANRIYAARAGRLPIPFQAWQAVTDGGTKVDKPVFSPDGRLVYFTLDSGAVRTIQAIGFDPREGQPVGGPFVVFDGGTPLLSLAAVNIDALRIAVARSQLVSILGESPANIWIAQPVPHP